VAPYLREVLPGPGEVAEKAAGLFVIAASSAISARGTFNVAFSGGSTPKVFLSLLSGKPHREAVDWDSIHVFFADERCVPPSDEMSNFRMASHALLSHVPAHIHRIEGELGAEEAARRYGDLVSGILGNPPVLDMVFLGMGEDGHTASLFPGSRALEEKDRLTVAVPEREPLRVSLTLPVINSARSIVFLVTGEKKASALRDILERGNPAGLPAGMVDQKALWLLDGEAASALAG
jgi:6-phosphogluconolactonase